MVKPPCQQYNKQVVCNWEGIRVPSWVCTTPSYSVGKTQLETENEMKVSELIQALSEMPQDMPVHFWANGERQTIIDVCNVGDCVDLYEEEAS
jgi:hypothetical protein